MTIKDMVDKLIFGKAPIAPAAERIQLKDGVRLDYTYAPIEDHGWQILRWCLRLSVPKSEKKRRMFVIPLDPPSPFGVWQN